MTRDQFIAAAEESAAQIYNTMQGRSYGYAKVELCIHSNDDGSVKRTVRILSDYYTIEPMVREVQP